MSYVRSIFNHYLLGTDIFNWSKLLYRSKHKVNLSSIPKAIVITLSSIINLPVILIDNTIYRYEIKNMALKSDPVFVIGHYRSGTTYLVNLLSKDKQFAYFDLAETFYPTTFLTNYPVIKFLMNKLVPKTRPMDKVKLDFESPQEEDFSVANMTNCSMSHMAVFPKDRDIYIDYGLFENVTDREVRKWKRVYMYLIKKMSYKHGSKTLVLKSPMNTCKIKEILELFPNAKFVHIYRNPYDVCSSTQKMYKKLFPMFSLQGEVEETAAVDFQLTLYEKFFKKFMKIKDLIPEENYYELKYEEFIQTPMDHLSNIYKNLDLPNFEGSKLNFEMYIHDQKSYKASTYNISDVTKNRLNKNCSYLFEKYGYDML